MASRSDRLAKIGKEGFLDIDNYYGRSKRQQSLATPQDYVKRDRFYIPKMGMHSMPTETHPYYVVHRVDPLQHVQYTSIQPYTVKYAVPQPYIVYKGHTPVEERVYNSREAAQLFGGIEMKEFRKNTVSPFGQAYYNT